jgi:hypothetical protein
MYWRLSEATRMFNDFSTAAAVASCGCVLVGNRRCSAAGVGRVHGGGTCVEGRGVVGAAGRLLFLP